MLMPGSTERSSVVPLDLAGVGPGSQLLYVRAGPGTSLPRGGSDQSARTGTEPAGGPE
jgi:hypothetical protein